jgi:hypothetical protein
MDLGILLRFVKECAISTTVPQKARFAQFNASVPARMLEILISRRKSPWLVSQL